MKLGLGTVQFGLNYGVSNSDGQTSSAEVENILAHARKKGIDLLDSAYKYGNSHQVLASTNTLSHFKLVTKLGAVNGADSLRRNSQQILSDLRVNSLYGLMFHSIEDFQSATLDGLSELHKLQKEKVCEKIGISLYNSDEIKHVWDKFDFNLIQLPLGILNQENYKNGIIEHLKEKKVEIHIRSIFLQGLVFLKPEKLPAFFSPIRTQLVNFYNICEKFDLTPLELSFAYVKSLDFIDRVIIGVNSLQQLDESISAFEKDYTEFNIDYSQLNIEDHLFSEPRNWKL